MKKIATLSQVINVFRIQAGAKEANIRAFKDKDGNLYLNPKFYNLDDFKSKDE